MMLVRGLAKSTQIFAQQRAIERYRASAQSALREEDPHFHVPAGELALDQCPQGVFERIRHGRGVHMHVQRTVVERLHADRHLTVTGGTADLGTAGDPGGNTLTINGTGDFVDNSTATSVSTVGDTFLETPTAGSLTTTVTDNFQTAHDYAGGNVAGTIWDGVLNADHLAPGMAANGQLTWGTTPNAGLG